MVPAINFKSLQHLTSHGRQSVSRVISSELFWGPLQPSAVGSSFWWTRLKISGATWTRMNTWMLHEGSCKPQKFIGCCSNTQPQRSEIASPWFRGSGPAFKTSGLTLVLEIYTNASHPAGLVIKTHRLSALKIEQLQCFAFKHTLISNSQQQGLSIPCRITAR